MKVSAESDDQWWLLMPGKMMACTFTSGEESCSQFLAPANIIRLRKANQLFKLSAAQFIPGCSAIIASVSCFRLSETYWTLHVWAVV